MSLKLKAEYFEHLQSIRFDRRRLLASAALFSTGALLAACGSDDDGDDDDPGGGAEPAATDSDSAAEPTSADSEAEEEPAEARTLVIGIPADITTLNPQLSTFNNDVQYSFNLFDNLIARRPDGQLYPMLATEWEMIDDNTWEFTLRDDVTFHNGDPFTSADVKFSIERTYDPEAQTRVATIFSGVDTIETPDDYTVTFITTLPDPLLAARLAFYGGQIMPKAHFEEVGVDEFSANPIGTGPVRFVEHVRDDRLVLDANPDYWSDPVAFDTVVFRPIPELSSRMASLLAGEIDMVTNLTPDAVEELEGSDSAKVAKTLYSGMTGLNVNSTVAPLDNPLVKQALSMAIDRESIVTELWRGLGIVPNSLIARGDFAYDPDKPPYAYDPDGARALLEEAGYNDEPIYIQTTDGVTTNDKPMADALVAMWQEVGINAIEEVITLAVRAELSSAKTFKGLSWIEPTSTTGDPDGMMWRLLGPGAAYDYWRHPEFDELGAEAHNSVDEERRLEAYRRMVEIYDEYLPIIPVIQAELLYGVQNFIEWQPNGTFQFDLRAYNLKIETT